MTTPNMPPGWYPSPDETGTQRFWDGQRWLDPDAPKDPRSTLIRNYGIAVSAGLALLVAVVLWGVFNKPEPVTMTSPSNGLDAAIAESESESHEENTGDAESDGTVDANLQFTIDSVEATGNVTSPDNEFLSKDAQGEFIVVHLFITNVGDETAFYMANLQKLIAGTDVYEADPEASYYLGNIYEEIPPGGQVESSLVFDVPEGTVPDALEAHGDAITDGTVVPLQ